MKAMKFSMSLLAAVAAMVVCLASSAFAEVTFEWVTIGTSGNAADPLHSGTIPGMGSVANEY